MPLIASHRGVHGRQARRRTIVENSIPAIDEAIAAGADMVEIDVRRTLDGVWVLNHDARVAGLPVGRYTYAQLERMRRARRGAWPRLEDVAAHAAGRIRLDVELKEQGDEGAIGDVLLRHLRPDEFVITSFFDDVIAAVKRAHPEIRAGLLLGSARPTARIQIQEIFPFGRAERSGADFIVPHASIADVLIPRAAKHGLGVMVWTMGREAKLTKYVHDPRVEAVITDRPAEAILLRDGAAVSAYEGLGA
jgi:glycerophosphoryl diester phosphodiesterase